MVRFKNESYEIIWYLIEIFVDFKVLYEIEKITIFQIGKNLSTQWRIWNMDFSYNFLFLI